MVPVQTAQIIRLINEGKTCNQICAEMNLTNMQLYQRLTNLKMKGLFFDRKYYSDGNIVYKQVNNYSKILEKVNSNEETIITRNDESIIKCLALSDVHVGSDRQRLDLLEKAYSYCINNGIHLVINCGDFIDGVSNHPKEIEVVYDQIDYLIKNYPFDSNILTFGVGGNHDYSALKKTGQDLLEIVNNYRHDIIIPSYRDSFLNIKKDRIRMSHCCFNYKDSKDNDMPYSVKLNGHIHNLVINRVTEDIPLEITLSSLSGIDFNNCLPSVVELTLSFCITDGNIRKVEVKPIYFADKPVSMGKFSYNLEKVVVDNGLIDTVENYDFLDNTTNKDINKKNNDNTSLSDTKEKTSISIDNLDNDNISSNNYLYIFKGLNEYLKNYVKQLKKEEHRRKETTSDIIEETKRLEKSIQLSQIDKFNKRWGL